MTINIFELIILLLLILNIVIFILGYILGKISKISITQEDFDKNTSPTKKRDYCNKKNTLETINIDETKIVSKINTDNLEKKYDNLGNKTISNNNIGSSIDKLKKLKD